MTLYTRHQLVVLLILLGAAGLGLAVGHWRRAYPDLVERVEQFDRQPATTPARISRSLPAPKLPNSAIDVNRASAVELRRLPGVGPRLAERIVAARETGGPFAAFEDLRRVRGLSRQKIERLRPLLRLAE